MSPKRKRSAFRPRSWAWLLLLVALLAPAYDLLLPAGPFPKPGRATVIIERGESLRAIASELQRSGLLRSPIGFLVLARLMHLDRHVKAGQYAFRVGTSVPALLRALARGMYGLDLLTIPEGLTLREVSVLLAPRLHVEPHVIDSLAHDPAFLDSVGVHAPSLEGYLAPDSYEWLPGTSPEVALRTLVEHTLERVQRATAGRDSMPLGFTPHQLLTMASIVESEAQAKDERAKIARVYLNRLQMGMRLQADPTVGFAMGRNPRSRLLLRDYRFVSDYNTYLHDGLPPGPICSPGLASIEAVMNPVAASKDLYFVARGDGHHFFAATFAQHVANIAAARALQATFSAARQAADSVAVIPPVPSDTVKHAAVAGPPAPEAKPASAKPADPKARPTPGDKHPSAPRQARTDTTRHR